MSQEQKEIIKKKLQYKKQVTREESQ